MNSDTIQSRLFPILIIMLGIWADVTFYGNSPGLNLSLWFIPLIVLVPVLGRLQQERLSPLTMLFLGIAAGLSLVPVFRDSVALVTLSILAILFALVVAACAQTDLPLWAGRLSRYCVHIVVITFRSAFIWIGIPDFVRRAFPEKSEHRFKHLAAILRGLLFSIPILFIFVFLFTSADAQYELMIVDLIDLEFETIFAHTFLIAFFTWLSLTILATFVLPGVHEEPSQDLPVSTNRWALEVLIVLSSVVLVFLSYVYFQLGYLFGGLDHVLQTEHLTVAEFARKGFFESTIAAGFALLILLAFDEHLNRDAKTHRTAFTGLSIGLIILVAVVIASAMQRMAVYRDTFGLTEDRFYVTGILIWLIGACLWFAITLLRTKSRGFVIGAILWGYLCFATVIFVNPHAYIATTNLNRLRNGLDFDADYAATLSADATPSILRALDVMTSEQQTTLSKAFQNRQKTHAEDSFFSWSLPRKRLAQQVWPTGQSIP